MCPKQLNVSLDQMRKLQSDLMAANIDLASVDPPMPETGYFLLACSKRVDSLIDAEIVLLHRRNYTVAATLVRLVLDTALRIYAIDISADRDAVARAVGGGQRICQMKNRQGALMSDQALRKGISKFFPWVSEKYELYCGWIHFSKEHLLSLASTTIEPGWLYVNPTSIDGHISDEEFEIVASDFVEAAGLVLQLLQRWSNERRLVE